jgi:SAM-dependent methyltransferase
MPVLNRTDLRGFLLTPVLLALLLTGACRDDDEDDGLGPARVPSSFVEPGERDVARYQTIVRETVAAGEPLHLLFGPRSRSVRLVEKLALGPEDVVADVGCGTGALALLMLESGTPFRKLYAVDIDPPVIEFLSFVLDESKLAGRERVEPVVSTEIDVSLPQGSVDVLLMLNTPFYLTPEGQRTDDPKDALCLQSIRRALKPDGRLHVFERALDPAAGDWCAAIQRVIGEQGFRVQETEMLELGVPGEGEHCWVSFSVDADASVPPPANELPPPPGGGPPGGVPLPRPPANARPESAGAR